MKLEKHEAFWSNCFTEDNLETFREWVQHNSDSRKWLSQFLRMKKVSNILDVGCGIALDYACYLENKLRINYYGIDLTPVFVKYAKEKFPDINFQIASVKNIPYLNESFEAVSCRHLLEHLKNPEQAIGEMERVTKRYIIIIWFIPPICTERNEIRLAQFGDDSEAFYQNSYCYDYLELIFRQNNLILREKQKIGTDEVWVLSK